MTSTDLERLARSGELKAEIFTPQHFLALMRRAGVLLGDAGDAHLSQAGRFDLAYGASYAVATAALRLHGYRSHDRGVVFQCLEHTAGLTPAQCHLFVLAHDRHDQAETEGDLNLEEALLEDLLDAADNLLRRVSGMAPPH